MIIAVGSTNIVKTNAALQGVSHIWPEAQVVGFETDSGVGNQPASDAETKVGSLNRAQRALDQLMLQLERIEGEEYLGIGLEGGVVRTHIGLMNTVWCSVVDLDGNSFSSSGARFVLPERIAKRIIAGEEMGPVMDSLVNDTDVKKKQGMIGVVTRGFYTRTDEYASIVRLTVGLWYGRAWEQQL